MTPRVIKFLVDSNALNALKRQREAASKQYHNTLLSKHFLLWNNSVALRKLCHLRSSHHIGQDVSPGKRSHVVYTPHTLRSLLGKIMDILTVHSTLNANGTVLLRVIQQCSSYRARLGRSVSLWLQTCCDRWKLLLCHTRDFYYCWMLPDVMNLSVLSAAYWWPDSRNPLIQKWHEWSSHK